MASSAFGGVAVVVARVRQIQADQRKGARRGVELALRNVLNVSNSQVPHEEGDLERDGDTSMEDERPRGAVAYGRDPENRIKAVVQHEDMSLKHDPGRNAKYLERALASERARSSAIIAQQIRKATGA